MLLATELVIDGEGALLGLGGRNASDCDMYSCVSSSMSESEWEEDDSGVVGCDVQCSASWGISNGGSVDTEEMTEDLDVVTGLKLRGRRSRWVRFSPVIVTLLVSPGMSFWVLLDWVVAPADAGFDSVSYLISGIVNVKLVCPGCTIVIRVSVASNANLARSLSINDAKMETPSGSASLWVSSSPDRKGSRPPGKFPCSESTEPARSAWNDSRRVASSPGLSSWWMNDSATDATESAKLETSPWDCRVAEGTN